MFADVMEKPAPPAPVDEVTTGREMHRLIGDVHGKYGRYKTILKDSPYPTIQIGDMGIGFFKYDGTAAVNPPYDLMVEKNAKFIRGNHDNPAVCRRHTQFIPDGTVVGNTMFCGGAVSIDRAYRMEGFSWWPDEELSIAELNQLVDKYLELKPRVMITHECPELIANEVLRSIPTVGNGATKMADGSRTRQAFQSMWSAHSPEMWVFGHWHVPFDHTLNGTRFKCLPELETFDIEL